ncbi:Response regulator of zinc sigma-54-dependent two-component system [Rhodococcus wratislaviensis]|uniref:Response regulator of zinc sigma-54-dependent two-component system n=1 Tax=Rhodococcus wratislaviensis TaxID=44752 RepID=A0A402C5X9_RHOWR|nr:helix-turn-helix domain-containing protein [Rhodococcus wratislaviensis]GCE39030.1 Response regulator of zinc sigma-54-dependent two-component system [Rhodococcus wratislaviensis]
MTELILPGDPIRTTRIEPVRVRPTAASLARQRALREQFLSDPGNVALTGVREVIERSWRRSAACLVDPESLATEVRESRLDAPFLHIATPIMQRLDDMARDTGACVLLSDASGVHALRMGDSAALRWADSHAAVIGMGAAEEFAGTNSDGTALEEGGTVQVWGPEHYAEDLQGTYCTSAPILDGLRNRVVAVLTLMVPERIALASAPGALALPVEWAAGEIGRQVADRLTFREQALLRAYTRESRLRGGAAVVAIDGRTTIASNRAKEMLSNSDFAVLSAIARQVDAFGEVREEVVVLADSRALTVHVKPVTIDGQVIGAVMRLHEITAPPTIGGSTALPAPVSPAPLDDLIGASAVMRRLKSAAMAAVAQSVAVCLTGERGTGRTHLARLMAAAVTPDMAVIDCGPVDSGNAGAFAATIDVALDVGQTVVARNFDQLSPEVLEHTRDALRAAADRGRLIVTGYEMDAGFFTDAIGTVPIELRLPPLRSRRDDIPLLVAYFLRSADPGARKVCSGRLLAALANAEWPGNVAQLREVITTAAIRNTTGTVCVSDVNEAHQASLARGRLSRLEAAELEQIRHALAEAGGNRAKAADLLEIGRSTLYRKMENYSRRGYELS